MVKLRRDWLLVGCEVRDADPMLYQNMVALLGERCELTVGDYAVWNPWVLPMVEEEA